MLKTKTTDSNDDDLTFKSRPAYGKNLFKANIYHLNMLSVPLSSAVMFTKKGRKAALLYVKYTLISLGYEVLA